MAGKYLAEEDANPEIKNGNAKITSDKWKKSKTS
jgi:hypothetical protein